jgi:hypothetical protein
MTKKKRELRLLLFRKDHKHLKVGKSNFFNLNQSFYPYDKQGAKYKNDLYIENDEVNEDTDTTAA